MDDACPRAGLKPRIALEASNLGLLAQLACRGLGVAILPESVALALPADLHAIAITNPPMRGRMALAWRADGPVSPAARALIDRARKGLGAAAAASVATSAGPAPAPGQEPAA